VLPVTWRGCLAAALAVVLVCAGAAVLAYVVWTTPVGGMR
jgi:hypothetical protein